ncbi:MAG: DUF2817 domain-containing protein [Alphaproteobacteria bacterium]|nr:DUF2817 domain-containing protein [Alphaproteobacteria bacterium]
MLSVDNRFSRTYAEARHRFHLAAEINGSKVKVYKHPLTGPKGEEMASDVVWLGKLDAKAVMVVTSGVHGPELFCGSGAQIDALLDLDITRYGDVAMLLVHAVNPYGTAWLRRTNEDNIDINRNFADFTKPRPVNPGYEELADDFVPRDASEATWKAADARIKAYGEKHGLPALAIAQSGGQYTRPDGWFYGGTGPTWSRKTMESIVSDYNLKNRKLVAAVDFHTGAGPFGYCEPIYSGDPAHPGRDRLQRWIGPAMTIQRDGKSATPPQQGLSSELWEKRCGLNSGYVSFEYGTVPHHEVINSLRAEHVLHKQGKNDWHDASVQAVKQRLLNAFAPDHASWREMVVSQARYLFDRIARGLAAEA